MNRLVKEEMILFKLWCFHFFLLFRRISGLINLDSIKTIIMDSRMSNIHYVGYSPSITGHLDNFFKVYHLDYNVSCILKCFFNFAYLLVGLIHV
jgi:hypothetical protein